MSSIRTENRSLLVFFSIILIFISIGNNTLYATLSEMDNLDISTTEIKITSDDDFITYGFPGNGSVNNPFIIADLYISTKASFGIEILDTTVYFIIQNCTLKAQTAGIFISNSSFNTASIINCTSTVSEYGILLIDAQGTRVANNTCKYNRKAGIALDSSPYSEVVNNTLIETGLSIVEKKNVNNYYSYKIENNFVNGKKLGFFANLNNFDISEAIYGQLLLFYCNSVTIIDQVIEKTTIGIYILGCSDIELSKNKISDCMYDGIFIVRSTKIKVISNTVEKMGKNGIKTVDSPYILLSDNIANSNYQTGLYISYCDYAQVQGNTITDGRYMASVGIYVNFTSSCEISKNNITLNNRAIELERSYQCTISSNFIFKNQDYGVYLGTYSTKNVVFGNNFTSNNLDGSSQGFDDGEENVWYNIYTDTGNYWSDWSGTGSYSIAGIAGSEDLYPIEVNDDKPMTLGGDDSVTFTISYSGRIVCFVIISLSAISIISRRTKA
ncbi:MAG: right-handed parallel beta-helix repeat-containing protein [Candidatus Heimdallarchaeaceae archaeon]